MISQRYNISYEICKFFENFFFKKNKKCKQVAWIVPLICTHIYNRGDYPTTLKTHFEDIDNILNSKGFEALDIAIATRLLCH